MYGSQVVCGIHWRQFFGAQGSKYLLKKSKKVKTATMLQLSSAVEKRAADAFESDERMEEQHVEDDNGVEHNEVVVAPHAEEVEYNENVMATDVQAANTDEGDEGEWEIDNPQRPQAPAAPRSKCRPS